jgi:dihydrodipicolinate synthase/N-acetylneuraminate lyase
MLLEGTLAPITTPFYSDGRLYLRKLEHNTERYSRSPLSGLVILGSTGENVMLNNDETRQVLRTAADSTAAEKVLIAGVAQESVRGTIELAEYAAECRYDVVLVRTPHYYRAQYGRADGPWNELLTYYRTVADHSPLPVMLYNCAHFTAFNMPVEVVGELSAHPNIIGMKESGGDPVRLAALVAATRKPRYTVTVTPTFTAVTGRMLAPKIEENAAATFISAESLGSGATTLAAAPPPAVTKMPGIKTRTKEVGFQMLSGSADRMIEALRAGAVGTIHGWSTLSPQSGYEVYAAWKDGDSALADEKQARIAKAAARICGQLGIAGMKYACELTGYYGGFGRLPIMPLTAAERTEVEGLLAGIKS